MNVISAALNLFPQDPGRLINEGLKGHHSSPNFAVRPRRVSTVVRIPIVLVLLFCKVLEPAYRMVGALDRRGRGSKLLSIRKGNFEIRRYPNNASNRIRLTVPVVSKLVRACASFCLLEGPPHAVSKIDKQRVQGDRRAAPSRCGLQPSLVSIGPAKCDRYRQRQDCANSLHPCRSICRPQPIGKSYPQREDDAYHHSYRRLDRSLHARCFHA